MGEHIGARRPRLLTGDGQLLKTELAGLQPIARRHDTSARHDLNLVSAPAKLLPHRTPHLIHAVNDCADLSDLGSAPQRVSFLRGSAHIPMATGL